MKNFQHHSRPLVSALWTTSPHDPIQPIVALRQE